MLDGLPEPGDVIAAKYLVERVLGRGGMGTVFGVIHRETGKRLALKCLLPSYVNNPSVVERFIREAKAVGRIQHRHVIDIFDQGRDGGVLYMVLPLLEGKPLSELLHDEHLTLEEALVILVRAMEGVASANALGVLHRDLKPSNIFVCLGVWTIRACWTLAFRSWMAKRSKRSRAVGSRSVHLTICRSSNSPDSATSMRAWTCTRWE
jgi:serine/threonine protein kinase